MRISRRRARSLRWFSGGLGLLVLGSSLLGVGYFASGISDNRVPDDFVVSEGTVVEVERETRYSRRRFGQGDAYSVCAPIVETRIDGGTYRTTPNEYTFERDACEGGVLVGDLVPVAYAPGDPSTLRLAETDAVGDAVAMIVILALFSALGGWLLYLAIYRPEKTISKGVLVVEDGADATPLPRAHLSLLGVITGGTAVILGVGLTFAPGGPSYVVERAVIVDDPIPTAEDDVCVPTAMIDPDGVATRVNLDSLGPDPGRFCDMEVGTTFVVHHHEGVTSDHRLGEPPAPDRQPLLGSLLLMAGVGVLGFVVYGNYRWWARDRQPASR